MPLPRLLLHKDEVNVLFEPQGQQAPVPAVFAKSTRNKIVPVVDEQSFDTELQEHDITHEEVKPSNKTNIDAIKILEQIASDFVSLPHTADHSYFSLTFIMGTIVFGSAFLNMWIFAVPFNSVNDGLEHNRLFFYGILSYSEFITLIPWIETINYAMPDANLPVLSRIIAVLTGLMSQKLLDAFIAEGWWNTEHDTFYPIPFSTIVTEFVAVPVALFTLYALHRQAFQGKLLKCCWILFMFLIALFVAGAWAALFNRLRDSKWQTVWALAFGPLRFLVKIIGVAPTAIDINNKRWIFITLVVDLIFARIQVSTLPFIDDWATMLSLLVGSFWTLIWRYYSGVDRFQLLCCPYWKRVTGDKHAIADLQATYGATTVNIFVGVGMATLKDVHDATARSKQPKEDNSFPDLEVVDTKVGDDESTDTFVDIPLGNNEPQEQSSLDVATGSSDAPAIDRRAQFANIKAQRPTLESLQEEIWFQRQFYHIVDSIGSEILGLIVLMQHLGALWLTRKFPIHEHINASFDLTDHEWMQARIYGMCSIVGDIIIIASLTLLFRTVKERHLTMSRVLSYIFRNNFWFILLWVIGTGAYSCATMINHFGADFTLDIAWRHCRTAGTMAWPGCV